MSANPSSPDIVVSAPTDSSGMSTPSDPDHIFEPSPLPVDPTLDDREHATTPLYRTYKRRWYILALFSALACHQCFIWNTWGPISSAVKFAYGWSDSDVAMMANWGTIMFVLFALPLSFFLEELGLRRIVLIVSVVSALGTATRAVPLE